MFITASFKKSLIVEKFQGNYLKYYWYDKLSIWGFTGKTSRVEITALREEFGPPPFFPDTLTTRTLTARGEGGSWYSLSI